MGNQENGSKSVKLRCTESRRASWKVEGERTGFLGRGWGGGRATYVL